MAICMALILNFITIFRMPLGGSVTLGHIVPLIFFTFKNGSWNGFFIGFIYGVVKALLSFSIIPSKSIVVFILSFLLDYIVPYAIIGLSYFISKKICKNKKLILVLICVIANIFKLMSTIISGVFIWKEYLPSNINLWAYSAFYNSLYVVPETLISVYLSLLLHRYL